MNRYFFLPVIFSITVCLLTGCGDDDSPTAPTTPEEEPGLFGIPRKHWTQASMPVGIDTALSERAHVAWYNPVDMVRIDVIWNREIGYGESRFTDVLRIHFKPVDHKYVRDTTQGIIDSLSAPIEPERSWAGFMAPYTRFPAFTFPEGDAYLDIRMKGEFGGYMHIDIGRISEDVDGDGVLDAESRDPGQPLDPEDDVGLDGLPDELEFGYDPARGITDPAGDNFDGDLEDPANIWRINGTEGNADGAYGDPEGGWLPDSEDREFDVLDLANSYFSYRIDLTDTLDNSFYVPGTMNEYGWKTIRIPLAFERAIDSIVGTPSWDEIHYTRIWFDSATTIGMPEEGYVIDIAAFKIEGTGWYTNLFIADSVLGETEFTTYYVDYETDSRYEPPPPYTPDYLILTDILSAGKTLDLIFHDFHADVPVYTPDSGIVLAADTGTAFQTFAFIYGIIYDYLWLDAYVWGGIDDNDSVMCFLRFGVNDDHYVQYHTFINPGWHPDNHIHMNLTQAFDLWKQFALDQARGIDSSTVRQSGHYLVRSPLDVNFSPYTHTLFRYCAVGVVNLDGSAPASGDIWINGIRLTGQRF